MTRRFAELVGLLDSSKPVLVQTHDFPDHDAVGAAYGLRGLFGRAGFRAEITWGGPVQGISLSTMIETLGIEPVPFERAVGEEWQTVAVDGSPFSGTIREVAGELVGVVDHHPIWKKIECPFADVRTDVGSCSAIVWSYWQERDEVPDGTTATALLAGIQLDTDFLSRHTSRLDLDAHYALFPVGNPELARDVVRTSLSVDQLANIGAAFRDFRISGGILLVEVPGDCVQELLSVLADFLLRLREIDFVVVIEVMGGEYRLSARSRSGFPDAGHALRKVLRGIGAGGGHPHMAGGYIRPADYPGPDALLASLAAEIGKQKTRAAELRTADDAPRSLNETDSEAD